MVGVMYEPGPIEDDRHSTSTVASTVATTTSLASRIASLALDFADKLHDTGYEEREAGANAREGTGGALAGVRLDGEGIREEEEEEEDEEEEVVEITEEEMMQMLDSQKPAFQVCLGLFLQRGSSPSLKKLSMAQIEDFKQRGYIIVDNFVSKDTAARLRLEATRLFHKGAFMEAKKLGAGKAGGTVFTDPTARGDHVMWLHPGKPPTDQPPFSTLLVALHTLQEDLHEVMRLRSRSAEYQLAFYPGGGAQYVKHRDAFPDDGSEENQRRVTAVVYCSADWEKEQGGALRLWPPKRVAGGVPVVTQRRSRSPMGSETGTSYSEISDCGSIRSHFWGAGSTTSSMVAEAAQPEHDTQSVDAFSLAESEPHERGGMEWQEVEGEMVLDVAPLAGRLVLFLSGAVDHAVQPTYVERAAVTAWLQ